jgi:hypothetical protein
MCAVAIGLSSSIRGRAVNPSRLRLVITTGVATGLVSVVAFGDRSSRSLGEGG